MSTPEYKKPQADPLSLMQVADTSTVHHGDEGSGNSPRPKKIAELQLVSMLDVCFQLLIFFILTTNFAVGEGVLPAVLPTGQGAKPSDDAPPEQPITILLRSLGGEDVAIEILGSSVSCKNFAELSTVLQGMINSPSNPAGPYTAEDPVIIQPDSSVQWGHVVNSFNSAVTAKFANINFAKPQKK